MFVWTNLFANKYSLNIYVLICQRSFCDILNLKIVPIQKFMSKRERIFIKALFTIRDSFKILIIFISFHRWIETSYKNKILLKNVKKRFLILDTHAFKNLQEKWKDLPKLVLRFSKMINWNAMRHFIAVKFVVICICNYLPTRASNLLSIVFTYFVEQNRSQCKWHIK